jgi:hypothetical protein
MIIDNLTIAGLIAASAFTLMPILMGREFIRVRECPAPASARPQKAGNQPVGHQPLELAGSCVER